MRTVCSAYGQRCWLCWATPLKGVIAVAISWLLLGDNGANLCVYVRNPGACNNPIFYDFKGGKGVLTTAAMVAVFDWRIAVILVIIFVIIVAITRYVSAWLGDRRFADAAVCVSVLSGGKLFLRSVPCLFPCGL